MSTKRPCSRRKSRSKSKIFWHAIKVTIKINLAFFECKMRFSNWISCILERLNSTTEKWFPTVMITFTLPFLHIVTTFSRSKYRSKSSDWFWAGHNHDQSQTLQTVHSWVWPIRGRPLIVVGYYLRKYGILFSAFVLLRQVFDLHFFAAVIYTLLSGTSKST